MQLKKDTEFAMRITYCLVENRASAGMTVSEISRNTEIPRIVVVRLCKILLDAGIISGEFGSQPEKYLVTEENMQSSLKDIVSAVENRNELFAVFDRKSEMFSDCSQCLTSISDHINAYMDGLHFSDMFFSGESCVPCEEEVV